MAKHRARTHGVRRLSVVLAVLGVVFAAVLTPQAANAAIGNKIVYPSNNDVKAKCSLQAKSVNVLNDTVTFKLSAQAQPATFSGYGDNVFTRVDCYLFDPDSDLLATLTRSDNSSVLLNSSTTVTVPNHPSYILCGQASVKLKNGNTSTTPFVCA